MSELADKNRRILAARWPAGRLKTCEDLEAEHPGWSLWWSPGNTVPGFERPAGFLATRGDGQEVRGADAAEVRAGIAAVVERTGDPGHTPQADTFMCTACGQPWPCPPARQHLINEFPSRPELSMAMAAEMEHAVRVLPADVTPAELFDRFLGWTRRV